MESCRFLYPKLSKLKLFIATFMCCYAFSLTPCVRGFYSEKILLFLGAFQFSQQGHKKL